jgi:glycosyltransferase involved in cell wall biosynthesis
LSVGSSAAPDLTVIIIGHQVKHELVGCLESLKAHAGGLRLQVVYVDNGSTDGSAQAAEEAFPGAEIVRLPRNEGLPARNYGLRRSRGRNRMFIDTDATVTEGALETMCSILDSEPAIGLVGPRLVYPDGSLQLSARRYPPLMLPVLRRPPLERFLGDGPAVRRHLMADEAPLPRRRVEYVLGACQMFSARAQDAAGEHDYLGVEEVGDVRHPDSEIASRLPHHRARRFVELARSFGDVFGSDPVERSREGDDRRVGILLCSLHPHARDRLPRSKLFEAAPQSAVTQGPVRVHYRVPQFGPRARVASHQATIDDDPAPDAGAQREHNDVVGAHGRSESPLPPSGRIRVVVHDHGKSNLRVDGRGYVGVVVDEVGSERDRSAPGIDETGGPDAHRSDLCIDRIRTLQQLLDRRQDALGPRGWVRRSFDAQQDLAVAVDDRTLGTRSSDIDSDDCGLGPHSVQDTGGRLS